jgi:hypothetical protein
MRATRIDLNVQGRRLPLTIEVNLTRDVVVVDVAGCGAV